MEKNKGVRESRTLESRPVAAEDIGFPFAAQAALITQCASTPGAKTKPSALVTEHLPPEALDARQWLRANRQILGDRKRHPPALGRVTQ